MNQSKVLNTKMSRPVTDEGGEGLLHSLVNGVLWLEPLWIAVVAPSILLRDLLWDAWVLPWIVGALFLFWPLRLLATRRLLPATPLNWPIGLLLLWSQVTLWVSGDVERSWMGLGFLAFGIALYVALLNWPPAQQHPWLVAAGLGLVGVSLSAIGPALLQRIPAEFFGFSTELVKSKPADLFGMNETMNANVLAGALLLPIPVLTALALRWDWGPARVRRWLPMLIGVVALLMGAVFVLAQSRGGYLALAVGLIVLLLLRWPQTWIVLTVTLIAAVSVLAGNGVVLFAEAIGSSGSVTSLSNRWEIWQRAWYALRDFPITGIGIGTFDQVIPALYPYSELMRGTHIPHAHNLLLQVGVDLGLPGLLAYVWLLGSALRILINLLRNRSQRADPDFAPEAGRRRRDRHDQRRRAAALRWTLTAGALAALISMLVHGIVDAATWGNKVAFLPWMLLALIGLLYLQAHDADESEPNQN